MNPIQPNHNTGPNQDNKRDNYSTIRSYLYDKGQGVKNSVMDHLKPNHSTGPVQDNKTAVSTTRDYLYDQCQRVQNFIMSNNHTTDLSSPDTTDDHRYLNHSGEKSKDKFKPNNGTTGGASSSTTRYNNSYPGSGRSMNNLQPDSLSPRHYQMAAGASSSSSRKAT